MAASTSYGAAEQHQDDNNDKAVDQTAWLFIPLETYLQNVMNAIDPSFRMPVTEQHRKKMIRCLMGYSKNHDNNSTLDVQVQTLNAQVQWEKSSAFLNQHVAILNPSPVDVPHFDEGIRQWQQLQHDNRNHIYLASAKFYSSLVRGRKYKGQFELLLQDVAPHLVDTYQEIVRERSDLELMKLFILKEQEKHCTRDGIAKAKCDESENSQHSHHNQDNDDHVNPAVIWKDQLLELLEKDFGDNEGADQPAGGGKEMGIQGEMELVSFLQERFGSTKHNHQTNSDANANTNSKTMVLSNVLVKPHSRHHRQLNQLNNAKKRTIPHVILSDANPHGMTSEFDAMVVEKVLDNSSSSSSSSSSIDSLRIVQLWEAKNILHPISISDCMMKKLPAMRTVLDDPEARICFYHPHDNPEFCDLLGSGGDNSSLLAADANFLSFPLFSSVDKDKDSNKDYDTTIKLGIFGNYLLSPEVSARRIQCVHCEALLGKSPKAVLEALETGSVPAPNVIPHLQDILEEVQNLQPIVVVPVSANNIC